MLDLQTIVFRVGAGPDDDPTGPLQITPIIGGLSLIDQVRVFERAQGFSPAGGYAGLIPANFGFGDLAAYYHGVGAPQWPKPGFAWVLGCNCGDVGCWPLTAKIDQTEQTVLWSNFGQDHRPTWDYSGFGPFAFNRAEYDAAVRVGAEAVGLSPE